METNECMIIGVYFSPNRGIVHLKSLMHDIGMVARSTRKPVIVAGDLNAKSPLWGSRAENERGTLVAEWLLGSGMSIANKGDTPTFEKGGRSSVIDITLTSPSIADRMTGWVVRTDIENLSDHHYITFNLESSARKIADHREKNDRGKKSWKIDEDALKAVAAEMKSTCFEESINDPARCVEEIKMVLNRTCLSRRPQWKRRPVYWWNEEIATLRKACLGARRKLTRLRGKRQPDTQEVRLAHNSYKADKKALRKAIAVSQKAKWRELLETVNKDPWGKAYKIVTGKLKEKISNPDATERRSIAKSLFPTHPNISWSREEVTDGVTLFSEAEVLAAADRIKIGKAPGPDGIPPVVVRMFLRVQTRAATALMNCLFEKGLFPEEWKRASLVLIPKPKKKETDAATYRPICLLDVMGKVYERLVLNRLDRDMEEGGGLSDDQYGFRKGRSTVDAVNRVIHLATEEEERHRHYRGKPVSALIAIDVQNAFNSAPWPGIMSALSRMGVSAHITNIVKSYLSDRKLEVSPGQHLSVTCGVPQGSVLGPTLWNCFYDEMLRLSIPHTSLVGYADDLIAVVTAKNKAALEENGSVALEKIFEKAAHMGITIAAPKTEAIVARGRRTVLSATFVTGGTTITTKEEMRYLGVFLNRNLSLSSHVEHAAEKANRAMRKLTSLMPNKRGPEQRTRRVLATAVYSVVLYACPAWERAMRHDRNRARIERVQRVINIKVTQAYRTTSSSALCVIAGYPPAALMTEGRCRLYREGARRKADIDLDILVRWQDAWNQSQTGKWTRTLIPNIRAWLERKYGETEYFLTQFLTGHGNFKTYLARIGKGEHITCDHCGEADGPGHAVLECPRWENLRRETESAVGRVLTPESVVALMTQSEDGWKTVHTYVKSVLSEKDKEDREILQYVFTQ
jgi:Reverse transcriptase (RNA-dependent DNA polymerase)/Endonuclease-reverse transcriptase